MATAVPDAEEYEHDSVFRSAEREPFPEGSVPLHQLCGNCTRFFDNWDALDRFAESGSRHVPHEMRKEYNLCTDAHMLQSRETCHFCMMVFSELSTSYKRQNKSLEDRQENNITLKRIASSRARHDKDYGTIVIKHRSSEFRFRLKKYNSRSYPKTARHCLTFQ
jgi:hypothetical protein